MFRESNFPADIDIPVYSNFSHLSLRNHKLFGQVSFFFDCWKIWNGEFYVSLTWSFTDDVTASLANWTTFKLILNQKLVKVVHVGMFDFKSNSIGEKFTVLPVLSLNLTDSRALEGKASRRIICSLLLFFLSYFGEMFSYHQKVMTAGNTFWNHCWVKQYSLLKP